jgi:hypothetical protein
MSSEGPCPGTCNRHYREAQQAFKQALADYDPLDANQSRPIPPGIQPWPGDPWCGRCKSRIRETLAELDYLAGMLAAIADGHRTGVDNERVSGTAVRMSPSQAGDDLDELRSILAEWEDAYCKEMKWEFRPRRGHLASPETETINWLGKHLDDILRHPDIAVPFGEEILQWHREFTSKTKAGTRKLRKPLRCPKCRLLTLTWTEGDAYVVCGNSPECGVMIPLREYEAETARLAESFERGEVDTEVA